jgi:hypothetical protein
MRSSYALYAADRILTSRVYLLAPLDPTARLLGQVTASRISIEHHEQWRRRRDHEEAAHSLRR